MTEDVKRLILMKMEVQPFVYLDDDLKMWLVEGGWLEMTGASFEVVEGVDGAIVIRGRAVARVIRRSLDVASEGL
ncbi:MAG: hypothetical protein ACRDV9_05725 [Acidimicrobiia bacterium]